jgi:phosphate transport system protein
MMAPRSAYQGELTKLNKEVAMMGSLAQDMVSKGIKAFLNGDEVLIDEVVALDSEIYCQEQVIERHCFEIIALHQPVASDLRTVSSCLKVVTDLNRIGRYGCNIAQLGRGSGHPMDRHDSLSMMGEKALSMVRDAVDSFVKMDKVKAMALLDMDVEIDDMWESMFQLSLGCMIEQPQDISALANGILMARYLERIADHACNIAERTAFMVSGVRLHRSARKKMPRLNIETSTQRETSADGYYNARLDEK